MSRIEKILQAMIDGISYSEEPQSRIEEILLAIKNNTQYSDLPQSRIEEILLAIKNNSSYDKESMSRIEEILIAKLKELEYTKLPQSRIEELLIEWLIETADKELEGMPPLTFKSSGRPLKNYRIYGNTVDDKSVGDKTENLFANLWKKGYIRADNGREEQIDGFICSGFFPVEYGQTYSISRNINVGYDNIRGYRNDESFVGAGTDVCNVSNPIQSGATKIGTFTVTNENVAFIRFNDSANDLGMKYMIVEGTYTEQTMPAYEPYGYRMPVTISGKNLIDRNTLINGYYTDSTMTSIAGLSGNYKSFKVFLPAGIYTFSCSEPVLIIRYITPDVYTVNPVDNKFIQTYSFTIAEDCYVSLAFRNSDNTPLDDNVTIQIERALVATEYEPYHTPVTTPIYLHVPIRKVGDEAEYIDYAEQKQHFADGTSVDVTIPAIPTIVGTNILSVDTQIQPSKVYVKYKGG